jgi:transcriptional regulator with XRE-family HTH domain
MKDRLIRFMTSKQLSAAQFADEIGVQRSSISHVLSGRNKPSFDFIQKMLKKYPGLNPEWLILGKGNMYKEMVQKSLFDDLHEGREEITENKGLNDTGGPRTAKEKIVDVIQDHSNRIEKIVVFYQDNTFKEYNPRG